MLESARLSAAIVALVVLLFFAAIAFAVWVSHLPARTQARTRALKKRERALQRTTTSSEIYVDSQCCTSCGVPWSVAPDLFEERDNACVVRQQPRTVPELRRALKVFVAQDLGCVRYRGTDPRVVALLTKVGCRTHCDEPESQRSLPLVAASSTAARPASSSST